MGRQAAMVTTWAASVPGREAKAIEAFMDYMTLFGKQAADGRISEPEAFLKYDGSGGMGIVRGDSDVLMELWESNDFREILVRAQLCVQDLHTELYGAGDSVQENITTFTRVADELGVI